MMHIEIPKRPLPTNWFFSLKASPSSRRVAVGRQTSDACNRNLSQELTLAGRVAANCDKQCSPLELATMAITEVDSWSMSFL